MPEIRVGVLRGGPSAEYDVSLKTGANVLANIPSHYRTIDILLTKDGHWQVGGLPSNSSKLSRQVDVIFNCLHGNYGEDGGVQSLLDNLMIPYTGSTALASAIGMNKILTKRLLKKYSIKSPLGIHLTDLSDPTKTATDVFKRISPPWVIKPADQGSSVGVFIVKKLADLPEALEKVNSLPTNILVEEYISGREATVGVIDDFRAQNPYVLLPLEIRPPKDRAFFDYQAKYSGESEEICPGNFTEEEKTTLEDIAKSVHLNLGLRHYSRSDFIVSRKGVYFLEVNTLPGLTTDSLLPKALEAIGCSYPHFLDHVLNLALRPNK